MTIPYIQFQRPRRDPSLIKQALTGLAMTAAQSAIRHPFELMAEKRAEGRQLAAEGRATDALIAAEDRAFERLPNELRVRADSAFEEYQRTSEYDQEQRIARGELVRPTPEQLEISEREGLGLRAEVPYAPNLLQEMTRPYTPIDPDVYRAGVESGYFGSFFKGGPIPPREDITQQDLSMIDRIHGSNVARTQAAAYGREDPFFTGPPTVGFLQEMSSQRKLKRDEEGNVTGTTALNTQDLADLNAYHQLVGRINAGLPVTEAERATYDRALAIETVDMSGAITPQLLRVAARKVMEAPASDAATGSTVFGWAVDLNNKGLLESYYEATEGQRLPGELSGFAPMLQENQPLVEAMLLAGEGWTSARVAEDPRFIEAYRQLSKEARNWLQYYWYMSGESDYLFPESEDAIRAGNTKSTWYPDLPGQEPLPLPEDEPEPGTGEVNLFPEEGGAPRDRPSVEELTGITYDSVGVPQSTVGVARKQEEAAARQATTAYIESLGFAGVSEANMNRAGRLAQRIATSHQSPDIALAAIKQGLSGRYASVESLLQASQEVLEDSTASETEKQKAQRFVDASESERTQLLRRYRAEDQEVLGLVETLISERSRER